MTVYAAGYLRTESAAAKLEAAERNRIVIPVEAPDAHGQAAPDGPPLLPASISNGRIDAAPDTKPTAARRNAGVRTESGNQTARTKPATVPVETAPVVVAAAQSAPPTTEPAAASAIATPAVPLPSIDVAKWKDGAYTGWGTSRHGDIEATVVIEGGKIASAVISQCLTRYSCSWVAHLQGQVVTRQSPEVDYVSGATQSTNAFYYAVVQALSKAK
jgi:uncharacterized protein with FMN-binding domain